jgi:hypothetical protein
MQKSMYGYESNPGVFFTLRVLSSERHNSTVLPSVLIQRYTHKTPSYITSSYKTSCYQTPSYRMSRIQNFHLSNVQIQNVQDT